VSKKLHIGEISEILDLYENGKNGASIKELAKIFGRVPKTIERNIEKYKNTDFSQYLEK